MDTVDFYIRFFGWCSVINMGILVVASIALILMRSWVSNLHGRMFGLGETDLSKAYFQYLAQYKIAIFVFNLVPYLALRISA